jgi:hypothetical protein
MLEQYKKTFLGMQAFMVFMAGMGVVAARSLFVGVVFYATMQVGAVLGAVWAARIKRPS